MTGTQLVGGVRCVRAVRQPPPGQPELWWFLPTGVVPERTAGGQSSLLLVPAGRSTLLQLGACLGPELDAVDGLRAPLARALGRAVTEVSLGPAPVTVEAAELLLHGPDAEPLVLARSATSGSFPHTALFRASLDPAAAELAAAAIGGRAGVLTVRFVGIRWQPGTARTRTSGSASWHSTTSSSSSTEGGTTVHDVAGSHSAVAAASVAVPDLPALEPTAGGDVADWAAGADTSPP